MGSQIVREEFFLASSYIKTGPLPCCSPLCGLVSAGQHCCWGSRSPGSQFCKSQGRASTQAWIGSQPLAARVQPPCWCFAVGLSRGLFAYCSAMHLQSCLFLFVLLTFCRRADQSTQSSLLPERENAVHCCNPEKKTELFSLEVLERTLGQKRFH